MYGKIGENRQQQQQQKEWPSSQLLGIFHRMLPTTHHVN